MLATSFLQNLLSVLVFVSLIVLSVIVLVGSVFINFAFELWITVGLSNVFE